MFGRIFRRDRKSERIADALYGAVVARARQPAFYSALGVPDNVSSRFEMVVLHLALLAKRLENGGEAARAAGQGAFDLFCRDMDNSLRELGVGDLSVPKKMRKVGEAYFGRSAAYAVSIAKDDTTGLAEALGRTVFDGKAPVGSDRALADYAMAAASRLRGQSDDAILENLPDFPDIDSFIASSRSA